jgi:predicted negative regulator of RcsB-dependent stress response
MLAQGQAQQAIDLIARRNSEAFAAQYREVEGDAIKPWASALRPERPTARHCRPLVGNRVGAQERLQMKLTIWRN